MSQKPVFKSEAGKKAIHKTYDRLLQKWPVPYESLSIPTRHGDTHIIVSGEKTAPPLILFHGSSSNSAIWLGDIQQFSKKYRTYAIDLLGEPGKSEATRPDLTGPGYIEWLDDIFAELGIQQATIIGVSLGGWMALKYATYRPEMVKELVLLCPSGVATQKISFTLKAICCLLLGKSGIKLLNKIVYGNIQISKEVIQYSTEISQNFNPRVEVIPLFSDEELRRLTMPTLLIAGIRDQLLPSKKTAARLQNLVPKAQIKLIPEAGHVLIDLADQILSFLEP